MAGNDSRHAWYVSLDFHDNAFSRDIVVINVDAIAGCSLIPGAFARVAPVLSSKPGKPQRPRPASGQSTGPAVPSSNGDKSDEADSESSKPSKATKQSKRSSDPYPEDYDAPATDLEKAVVFRVGQPTDEQLRKKPHMQISLHSSVKSTFGLANRQRAIVFPIKAMWGKASYVELAFRDQYLSRSDLWQMHVSELVNTTAFRGQQILFMGTIKARVKNIFQGGIKVSSAVVTTNTLPIFRSESARYVFFLQMSREMWEYDTDGTGEIMFNKVINGFLPDLFKQWQRAAVRHLVTIIMFSRIEYEKGILKHREGHTSTLTSSEEDERNEYRDYYRAVTTEASSQDWIKILYDLKRDFKTFLRDTLILPANEAYGRLPDTLADFKDSSVTDCVIAGRPTVAAKGNVLEAINLASYQFANDNVDRDLLRTGISLVIVTPGTGVFEVNYKVLRLVTETLVGNGIGIDLVALSPMPLHSVPLFKYKLPRFSDPSNQHTAYGSLDALDGTPRSSYLESSTSVSPLKNFKQRSGGYGTPRSASPPRSMANVEWSYALPHWIDVSFWAGDASILNWQGMGPRSRVPAFQGLSGFRSSCRMYELQMLGLMDIEVADISIPLLSPPMCPERKQRTEKDQPRIEGPHQSRSRNNTDSSHDTETDEDFHKRQLISWMDEHDNHVFRPKVSAIAVDTSTDDEGVQPFKRVLGSKTGMSAPLEAFHNENGGQDDKSRIRERTFSITSTTESIVSVQQDPMSLLAKSSLRSQQPKFKRQISLGMKGLSTTKAAPSTGLISTTLQSASSDMRSQATPSKPTSLLAQQLRESLRRKPSTLVESAEDDAKEKKDKSQHGVPIPFKYDPSVDGLADDLDLADATVKPANPLGGDRYSTTVRPPDHLKMKQHVKALRARRPTKGAARTPPSAISPWLTLLNPSNPSKENLTIASHYRRWQHVFPRPVSTTKIKWKSLTSPATLPLTSESFPTAEELREDYEEVAYHVEAPDPEDVLFELPDERSLFRQLVAVRLSHGFQIVIGDDAELYAKTQTLRLIDCFNPHFILDAGAAVLMSIGNDYHQLECHSPQRFLIKRFLRKVASSLDSAPGTKVDYRPRIRCKMAETYDPRRFILQNPRSRYNWSMIDEHSSGLRDELSSDLIFWRARFVLVPVEVPRTVRGLLPVAEVTDEETRVEGIQRLTQLWQRHRFVPPEEVDSHRSLQHRARDPNPLAIDYHTRDPSAVARIFASGQLDALTHHEGHLYTFPQTELYQAQDVELPKLAQHLQAKPPKGITMVDRRWHWKLYHKCFRGDELTTWLIANFRDVTHREEAVALGNELMKNGLFIHAQSKHRFRDGHYFYQLSGEFRVPSTPDFKPTGWFSRITDRSAPNTPSSEGSQDSPLSARPQSRHSREESASTSSGDKTPTSNRVLELSRMLQYDVDPRKRSWRPEIINLHYDRVHNPDNCYHIRIDWINVTSKLIDDAITTWSATAERYGLKLIEMPIAEACTIGGRNPFRAAYPIELALKPPPPPLKQVVDATSFTPLAAEDQHLYQKALLRKWDFVLDFEAAKSFEGTVNVTYSWGKPDYKYTQFVHKSGSTIVEIDDAGNLILFANRRHTRTPVNTRTDGNTDRQPLHRTGFTPHVSPALRPVDVPASPRLPPPGHRGAMAPPRRDISSPLLTSRAAAARLAPLTSPTATSFSEQQLAGKPPTAENIKHALARFCASPSDLEALYDEVTHAQTASAAPSPAMRPVDGHHAQGGLNSPRVPPALRSVFGSAGTGRDSRPHSAHHHLGAVEDIPSLGLPERRMGMPPGSLSSAAVMTRSALRDGVGSVPSSPGLVSGGGGPVVSVPRDIRPQQQPHHHHTNGGSGATGDEGAAAAGAGPSHGASGGGALAALLKPSSPRDVLGMHRPASHMG